MKSKADVLHLSIANRTPGAMLSQIDHLYLGEDFLSVWLWLGLGQGPVEGGSSFWIRVGAILLFFGIAVSSFSDSLVSLFPSTLPLTEPGLLTTPAMGVCGGVVHGRPLNDRFVAATLGTALRVGVGLFTTRDDCVAIEDAELDRVGLGGGRGAGEAVGAITGVDCFSNGGADAVVGLGCAVDMVDTAGEEW